MGFFWTNIFETAVNTSATITTGPVDVKVMLLARSPLLGTANVSDSGDSGVDTRSSLKSITTPASLLSLPGWVEVSGYTRPTISGCTIHNSGANYYVSTGASTLTTSFTLTDDSQVEAIVFLVDGTYLGLSAGDRVVFGTTTPFDKDRIIFRNGDGLASLVDPTISKGWLFGWAKPASGSFNNAAEGTVVLRLGAPDFESTRLQHAWLFPQRINYIANPSFEHNLSADPANFALGTASGLNATVTNGSNLVAKAESTGAAFNASIPISNTKVKYWQTNFGPMVRVKTDDPADPSLWAASVYGGKTSAPLPQYDVDSRVYVKSSSFYPSGRTLTFHLKARGTGVVRVALAWYSRTYSEYSADWGLQQDLFFQEWELSSDNYTDIVGIRTLDDKGYEAALLIEVRGILTDEDNPASFVPPQITLDNCIVEEGTLIDWPYFDGDSTYGAEGDFGWYGNDSSIKNGISYSTWYNNKKAIAGRLFGRRVDDTALYTSQDEQLDSLLSSWVPAGTSIIPHWGALSPNDTQILPVDKSASSLTVELWPEMFLPFELYEVVDVTPVSATLKIYGEGGHPITRGYILTEETGEITPVNIFTRPWEEPGKYQYEIDALLAELYDLSTSFTVELSWDPVSAFFTNVLYLERGTPTSPQSFLSVALLSAAGSGYGEAQGLAYDAVVPAYAGVDYSSGAGSASPAVVGIGTGAVTADGSGSVLAVSPTVSSVIESPTSSATANNAIADIMVEQTASAGEASSTGTASNAGNNVDTTPTVGIGTSTAYDGDPTAPAVITSFKPETSYGNMTVRWTYPAATDLVSASVEWSTNGGSTWVTDGTYTNPTGGSTASRSKVYTEPTTSTSITVRINVTDGQGITRTSATSTYTIVPTPIVINAASTNNWRGTNGGEWNNTGNSAPYQGQFSSGSTYNYRGFWFYSGTAFTGTGTTGLKYAGRTITSASVRIARAGDSGFNSGRTPILYGHALASNPGTVTNYGTPALQGTAQSTGLSLAYNGVGTFTLPSTWITSLTGGTWKGIASYNASAVPASTDSTSDYMRFDNLTEDSASGQISFNHLG